MAKKYFSRYEVTLLILLFFTWGFVFLDRLAISFLMPVIAPIMKISNAQVGMIGFVTTACFAVSALVFGVLSDKSGYRKRWLVPFVFATAVFSALCALAQTVDQLLVLRAMVGLAEGPLLAIMMVMVMDASSENQFGRNAGIVNFGVGIIAVTLGPIFITQLVSITTWQNAFLISALPTFIFAILLIIFAKEVRTDPKEQGGSSMSLSSFMEILKYRNILLCAIISICCMAGYWALMLFAPLYWVNVAHISVQNMGFLVAGTGIAGWIFGLGIPKLSDIFGRKIILAIFIFACAIVPLSMFLVPGSRLSMGIYLIFGAVPGCITPIFYSLIPMETVPDRLKATSGALIMACGEFIGGAVFQAIGGKVADLKGLPFMMLLCAILYLLGLVISLAIIETHPRKEKLAPAELPLNS